MEYSRSGQKKISGLYEMPPRLLRKSYGICATQTSVEVPIASVPMFWGNAVKTRLSHPGMQVSAIDRSTSSCPSDFKKPAVIKTGAVPGTTFVTIIKLFDTFSSDKCVEGLSILKSRVDLSVKDEELRLLAVSNLCDRIVYLLSHSSSDLPLETAVALLMGSLECFAFCPGKLLPVCLQLVDRVDLKILLNNKQLVKLISRVPPLCTMKTVDASLGIPQTCRLLQISVFSVYRQLLRNLCVPSAIEFGPIIYPLVLSRVSTFAQFSEMADLCGVMLSGWSLKSQDRKGSNLILAYALTKCGGISKFRSAKVYKLLKSVFESPSEGDIDKLLEICYEYSLHNGVPIEPKTPRGAAKIAAKKFLLKVFSNEETNANVVLLAQVWTGPVCVWSDWLPRVMSMETKWQMRFLSAAVSSENCPQKVEINRTLTPLIIMGIRTSGISDLLRMDPRVVANVTFCEEIVGKFIGQVRSGIVFEFGDFLAVLRFVHDKCHSSYTDILRTNICDSTQINGSIPDSDLANIIWLCPKNEAALSLIDYSKIDLSQFHRVGQALVTINNPEHMAGWTSYARQVVCDLEIQQVPVLFDLLKAKIDRIEYNRKFPDGHTHPKSAFAGYLLALSLTGGMFFHSFR